MLTHRAGRTVRCSNTPVENVGRKGASSSRCSEPQETCVQAWLQAADVHQWNKHSRRELRNAEVRGEHDCGLQHTCADWMRTGC